jgi:hypothetical protein
MSWIIYRSGEDGYTRKYNASDHTMHLAGDNIVITKTQVGVVGIFNTTQFYLLRE